MPKNIGAKILRVSHASSIVRRALIKDIKY